MNGPTLDTYYETPEQVRGATGILYNSLWFPFLDKAYQSVGDVRSGNMFTWDVQYSSFMNMTVQSTDNQVGNAWAAFYKIIGWSNSLIVTFEQKAELYGEQDFLTHGIAEARFMRGVAYFYVARLWENAPIITDPIAMAASGDYDVPRYHQADILRFAIEDLEFAEGILPPTDNPGRVTSLSATGMLAEIYLYRGSLSDDAADYDMAIQKAGEVINSGNYALYDDYMGMFTSSTHNNNIESIFSLQWVADGEWGSNNSLQAYLAPAPLLEPVTGTGWSAIVPSLDLLGSYEDGDARRGWSVMEHGFQKSDWVNDFFPNGFTYDTTEAYNPPEVTQSIRTATLSNVLKHVVGPGTNGEPVAAQRSSLATPILRYADVLLTYAEATARKAGGTTSDGIAVGYFNEVRQRAQLGTKSTIDLMDILHERRVEFAFEGKYWFDLQRMGFDRANEIIEAQERGYLGEGGDTNSTRVSLQSLYLPIPQAETVNNPSLNEPPVSYFE